MQIGAKAASRSNTVKVREIHTGAMIISRLTPRTGEGADLENPIFPQENVPSSPTYTEHTPSLGDIGAGKNMRDRSHFSRYNCRGSSLAQHQPPSQPAHSQPSPQRKSCQVGKVSVNDHVLVVDESGDWVSVIPIVVPVEAALKHIREVWGTRCHQLEKVAGNKSSAETDASILEAVMRDVRVGPIAGNRGTEEAMWALRRQGDMLYLVSGLVLWPWCFMYVVSAARKRFCECLEMLLDRGLVLFTVKFGRRVSHFVSGACCWVFCSKLVAMRWRPAPICRRFLFHCSRSRFPCTPIWMYCRAVVSCLCGNRGSPKKAGARPATIVPLHGYFRRY